MATLDAILSSSEKTHAAIGKGAAPPKTQPQGEDLFQALAQALDALHQQLHVEPPETRSQIEIEVRVGLICQFDRMERAMPSVPGSGAITMEPDMMQRQRLRFVSGISAADFEAVKEEIGRRYKTSGRPHQEAVYVYDSGSLQNQRVVMEAGRSSPYVERKETRKQMNFELPAAPYDLRVQASVEHTKEPLEGTEPPPGVSRKRTKRRISWKSPPGMAEEQKWLWQADLTLVEELSKQLGAREVREVELELLPGIRDRWLALSDREEVIGVTSQIATHLHHLLESINPLEPLSAITNPVPEHDQTSRSAALAACGQLKRPVGKGSAFPGAQPVNMCKRNVPDVQRGAYFVAEKTDGVRYLMLSVPASGGGETCVLVDRSMNVFRVIGGAFLAGVLGSGTILDGELVHNRSKKTAIFVAFDILRHRDQDLVALSFIRRLTILHEEVMSAYSRQVQAETEGASPDAHLTLVMKTFVPRQKIMDLFRRIHVDGRHRIFRDEGRSLHHKTDGIIFQPDTPYKMGTDTALLKWKWADLASVDLKVHSAAGPGTGGSLRLCSEAGQHGEEVDLSRSVHLSDHDKARLLADMGTSRSVIAEVALEPGSGLWVYMGLRPDKDRPNYITTVISTMVEVAEGLSEEELKYRMLADNPADDDWSRQEGVMRKRAVVWQYKRKTAHPHENHHQQKRARGGSIGGAAGAEASVRPHGGARDMNGHG